MAESSSPAASAACSSGAASPRPSSRMIKLQGTPCRAKNERAAAMTPSGSRGGSMTNVWLKYPWGSPVAMRVTPSDSSIEPRVIRPNLRHAST